MTGRDDDMGAPFAPPDAYADQFGEGGRSVPEPTHHVPPPGGAEMEGQRPLIRKAPLPARYPVVALGPPQGAVEALVETTQAPAAICAGSALAAAAMAVQGLADVETFGGDRPVSLFLMALGNSGERKSHVDRFAMKGVRDFEEASAPVHKIRTAAFNRNKDVWASERASILRGKDRGSRVADSEVLRESPEPPLHCDVIVGSATTKGLLKALPSSRASLGWMTDEGGQVLGGYSMKAENRLAGLAVLSKMWDGAPIDRIRAGMVARPTAGAGCRCT